VTVTFSIPWNVAIVLVGGGLSEVETSEAWLREHAGALRSLANRVRLRHDAAFTVDAARAFSGLLPPSALVRDVGLRRLAPAVRAVRAEHPAVGFGPADLIGLARATVGRSRGATRPTWRSVADGARWWDPDAVDRFTMTFPARVTIRYRDGSEQSAEAAVPRGAAGNESAPPAEVAR
jgi:hypothetical protein